MRINGASVQPVQKRFGFFNMLFDFQIVKRFTITIVILIKVSVDNNRLFNFCCKNFKKTE